MGDPDPQRPGGGPGGEVWRGLLLVAAVVVLVLVASYLFVSYL